MRGAAEDAGASAEAAADSAAAAATDDRRGGAMPGAEDAAAEAAGATADTAADSSAAAATDEQGGEAEDAAGEPPVPLTTGSAGWRMLRKPQQPLPTTSAADPCRGWRMQPLRPPVPPQMLPQTAPPQPLPTTSAGRRWMPPRPLR